MVVLYLPNKVLGSLHPGGGAIHIMTIYDHTLFLTNPRHCETHHHYYKNMGKFCSREGCTKLAIRGGVCAGHGGRVKRCSHKGCNVIADHKKRLN